MPPVARALRQAPPPAGHTLDETLPRNRWPGQGAAPDSAHDHSSPGNRDHHHGAALPDHLAYQAQLEQAGSLAFAGPMSDESGEHMQGIGMIVYRAESLDAAQALAEGDPMHQSGARSFVLRRWMINEGSLNLSVGLSTKNVVELKGYGHEYDG